MRPQLIASFLAAITLSAWAADPGPAKTTAPDIGQLLRAPGAGTASDVLFEQAVATRREREGLSDPHARIAVHREIAAALAARQSWFSAALRIRFAIEIARALEDSGLLIQLHLLEARYFNEAGEGTNALAALDLADAIIAPLEREIDAVESALLRAELLNRDLKTRPEAEKSTTACLPRGEAPGSASSSSGRGTREST